MNNSSNKVVWVIIASLMLAFILTILPLPNWINPLRPKWVLLVLIYWSISLPDRIGIGFVWLCGLFFDIFKNSPLGEHALIFTICIYLIIKFHARINFFPFWQKLSVIFSLSLLGQVLQFWFESLMGQPIENHLYWISVLTTTLFWPWTKILLQNWQQRFNLR